MKTHITASILLLSLAPANAAWLLVDDFESYASGVANGTGGWTADGATNFAADPADAANQALSSAETTGIAVTNVYKAIPTIDTTSIGTIFFRARAAATGDFVIGGSDVASPNDWSNYEGYLRFSAGSIDVRNGGGFNDDIGVYNGDEWYNVWMVLDHTSDTTTVHFNQGSADAPAAAGSGAFRTSGNTANNDIINLFIRNNDGGLTEGFIDDIYIDTTGVNLLNPVPEPATPLFLGLGTMLLLRRRR